MFFKDESKDRLTELLDELSKRVEMAAGKVGRITFNPHKVVVSGDPGEWRQTKTSSVHIIDNKDEITMDIAALASKINEQQKQINRLNSQLVQVVHMLKKLTADLSDDSAVDNFVDN